MKIYAKLSLDRQMVYMQRQSKVDAEQRFKFEELIHAKNGEQRPTQIPRNEK